MIIDAHMHIWKRIKGRVRNEQPVLPLGSGKIRIGDEEMLGMPASFVDCSALAEYVLAEFDADQAAGGRGSCRINSRTAPEFWEHLARSV